MTHFDHEVAGTFCLSPDGKWIVFQRYKKSEKSATSDLWIMRSDGSNMRLLVRNGEQPAWGKGTVAKP